jgi:multisubunit Na+/H+ antiporter MnhB subunit
MPDLVFAGLSVLTTGLLTWVLASGHYALLTAVRSALPHWGGSALVMLIVFGFALVVLALLFLPIFLAERVFVQHRDWLMERLVWVLAANFLVLAAAGRLAFQPLKARLERLGLRWR